MADSAYSFEGELFLAAAESPWVFVALPEAMSDEVDQAVPNRPGFGSVRVHVMIGSTQWSTSLFPSKELGTYVLPIKRSVRHSEGIDVGDAATVIFRIGRQTAEDPPAR